MATEVNVARESGVSPLNASSGGRAQRVTKKVVNGIMSTLNNSGRHDQHTEDLEYSRGTVTAYTIEKGYGDRPSYTEEYTSKPDRIFTGRDRYADAVFNAFERKGIKIRRFVHHGQYD